MDKMYFRKHFIQGKICSSMSRFQIITTTSYPWLQWGEKNFLSPPSLQGSTRPGVLLTQVDIPSATHPPQILHRQVQVSVTGEGGSSGSWISDSRIQPHPCLTTSTAAAALGTTGTQEPCLEQDIPPWAPTVLQDSEATICGLGFAVLNGCDTFQCLDNCSSTSAQRFAVLPTQKCLSHTCWH